VAQGAGQHPADLRESARYRIAGALQAQPLRGHEADDDHDRLVAGEHQRRQPVTEPHPVAAASTALAVDRDAELVQRCYVPANRPAVHAEPGGNLAARHDGTVLEQFQQLKQPGGGRAHAAKQTMRTLIALFGRYRGVRRGVGSDRSRQRRAPAAVRRPR
jgi:hypothetical protein